MQGFLYFQFALAQSLPLSTMVDWSFWMANNWFPSISALDHMLLVLLGEILASIIMCSQVFHLLVAFYRIIQILLPSLGTLWMVTQERGMIPSCATNIPLCAPLISKKALLAVLRQLQVWNHCPGVCFLWSQKVTFATPRIVHFLGQKAHKGALIKGFCAQKHLWLVQIWFFLRPYIFFKYFQIL